LLVVRRHPLVASAIVEKHLSHRTTPCTEQAGRADTMSVQTVTATSPRAAVVSTARKRAYRKALSELHEIHSAHLSRIRGEIGLASDVEDEVVVHSQSSSRHQLLEEIDEALRRLDDGTFGTCQDCGGAIAAGRLETLPYARRCPTCQRAAVT
jgi:DnaK suppressor protein